MSFFILIEYINNYVINFNFFKINFLELYIFEDFVCSILKITNFRWNILLSYAFIRWTTGFQVQQLKHAINFFYSEILKNIYTQFVSFYSFFNYKYFVCFQITKIFLLKWNYSYSVLLLLNVILITYLRFFFSPKSYMTMK